MNEAIYEIMDYIESATDDWNNDKRLDYLFTILKLLCRQIEIMQDEQKALEQELKDLKRRIQ